MTPEHKELILLAAKAMGYEYKGFINMGQEYFTLSVKVVVGEFFWNPLTSLSDRAAMCDQLEISTKYAGKCVYAEKFIWPGCGWIIFAEPYVSDKSHACSLACLKVAAEMGKQLRGEQP